MMTRLTCAGAAYITAVCLLPEFQIVPVVRPVLLRRHIAAHHRRRGDGLHGPGTGAHDVPPARGAAPQGESARLRSNRGGALTGTAGSVRGGNTRIGSAVGPGENHEGQGFSEARRGSRPGQEKTMKVRASVKRMCRNCKIVRRKTGRAGHLHGSPAQATAGLNEPWHESRASTFRTASTSGCR